MDLRGHNSVHISFLRRERFASMFLNKTLTLLFLDFSILDVICGLPTMEDKNLLPVLGIPTS